MDYYVIKFFNFLLGGVIFLTIDYCANELKNPDISALVSIVPISLICSYIIYDLTILKKHTLATIPSILITVGVSLLLYVFLFKFNKYTAITLSLIIWVILQYIRIKYIPL